MSIIFLDNNLIYKTKNSTHPKKLNILGKIALKIFLFLI